MNLLCSEMLTQLARHVSRIQVGCVKETFPFQKCQLIKLMSKCLRHPSRTGGYWFKAGELAARSPFRKQMHQTQGKFPRALRRSPTGFKRFVRTSGSGSCSKPRRASSLASGLWSCLGSRATSTQKDGMKRFGACQRQNTVWYFGRIQFKESIQSNKHHMTPSLKHDGIRNALQIQPRDSSGEWVIPPCYRV